MKNISDQCAPPRPSRPQRGQALIEFTIAAATLLVPLFFLIAYVAKYHDMQSATIQAARYAAWERTVYFGGEAWDCDYDDRTHRAKGQPGNAKWACGTAWKSDADIKNEVGRRFFAGSGSDLDDGQYDEKPFWSDHAGTSMLKSYDQVSSTATTPGGANKVLGFLFDDIIGKVSQIFTAEKAVKLDMQSLYSSTVTFTPENTWAVSRVFGTNIALSELVEKNVLVANGWSANGSAFVAAQIQPYTPVNFANNDTFKTGWDVFKSLAGKLFPEFETLDFTAVLDPANADKVPPDRLSGGAAVKPPKVIPPKPPRSAIADSRAAWTNFNTQKNDIQAKINSCAADKKAEMVRNKYVAAPSTTYTVYNNATTEQCRAFSVGWTYVWNHGCGVYFQDYRPPVCATSCEDTAGRRGCNAAWQCNSDDGGWAYMMSPETRTAPGVGEVLAPRPPNGYTPNFDNDYSCHGGLDSRIAALMPGINNDAAVIAARAACATNSGQDAGAAAACQAFEGQISTLQSQANNLAWQRPGLDPQFSSCGCAAGTDSNCRNTANTYTCQ